MMFATEPRSVRLPATVVTNPSSTQARSGSPPSLVRCGPISSTSGTLETVLLPTVMTAVNAATPPGRSSPMAGARAVQASSTQPVRWRPATTTNSAAKNTSSGQSTRPKAAVGSSRRAIMNTSAPASAV